MTQSIPALKLNDGTAIPSIGFGTYPLKGAGGVDVIKSAIAVGYRLLDSAFNYENEGAVGEAVRTCGVAREELLVTSKLPGRRHQYDQATDTIRESLYRAGLEYYDLYLIHWPNPSVGLYVEAWQALIDAQRAGLVRSIGVSNFLPEHLTRLIDETGVTPAINQVELHPYFQQGPQREVHRELGVVTQSWSPLGRANQMLEDPVLVAIAQAHGRAVGAIILRWHIQIGALPLPKASSPERQRDNLAVFDFELTDEEMAAIAGLAREGGRLLGQDPAVYEEF